MGGGGTDRAATSPHVWGRAGLRFPSVPDEKRAFQTLSTGGERRRGERTLQCCDCEALRGGERRGRRVPFDRILHKFTAAVGGVLSWGGDSLLSQGDKEALCTAYHWLCVWVFWVSSSPCLMPERSRSLLFPAFLCVGLRASETMAGKCSISRAGSGTSALPLGTFTQPFGRRGLIRCIR